MNPLGIPKQGYAKRAVPSTQYALFQKYSDFYTAFAKALSTERGGRIHLYIQSEQNTAQLWRELNSLEWPAAKTENDWPVLVNEFVGDEFREKLGMKPVSTQRGTGSAGITGVNNSLVMQTQRAMVTAAQTKMDLVKAIQFITVKGGRHGR
jgi:hypothetical protein